MLGNQHTLVLPYLENLCAHDETVVRERAVSSITKLLDLYADNDINNYIIPLIIRLASNEANFTCRVSATLLMCNVYPRAGPNKEKIRQYLIHYP
jgi:serine/threonine-protein phosphatase 2A regulatory subunit A